MKNRSTKTMTEVEYRAQIKKIRKERDLQARLDQLAETDTRKKAIPRLKTPPPPRPAVRYVQPQPPLRGLLAPEPTIKGFMGLLATTPTGSKS